MAKMADLSVKTLADFFKREKDGYATGSGWTCWPIEKPDHLLDIFIEYCCPMLGAEKYFPDLFGKYGSTITGIGDFWQWDFAALSCASEQELWQMLAIANTYWFLCYQRWYDATEKKMGLLDRFIGDCESAYFGYDKEYTDQSIEAVLNKIRAILKIHFQSTGGEKS